MLVRSVKFLSDPTKALEIWGLNEVLGREGQCNAEKLYLGGRDYSHT